MIKRTTVLAAAALLAMGGFRAWPQEKGGPIPAARPAEKKPVPWAFTFDQIDEDEKTKTGKATKVTATSDEGTTIQTDLWTWDDRKKTAHATGNLKMTDPQADGTGDMADVFYSKGKRLLVLTGNCVILVKPKKAKGEKEPPKPAPGPAPVVFQDGKAKLETAPPGDEDKPENARNYPATITCDKVEYEYAKSKKHAVLTGSFKVVQKLSDHTRTLTAKYAEWFGLEERILLHGPVHIEDTKRLKEFDTDGDVTVFTGEGEESYKASKGKGIYEMQGDDEEDDATKKPAEPVKKPAGADKRAQ